MRLAAQRYRLLAGACALPALLFASAFSGRVFGSRQSGARATSPTWLTNCVSVELCLPQRQELRIRMFGNGREPTIHATKLTVYLGSVRGGANQEHIALFYAYSTVEVPQGNGFAINTGLGMLSCEVNGMKLDYSGPPKPTS